MDINSAGTLNVSKNISAAFSRFLLGFNGASVSKTGCCNVKGQITAVLPVNDYITVLKEKVIYSNIQCTSHNYIMQDGNFLESTLFSI